MTMAAAAPLASRSWWGRPIIVTLAALALYRLGLQIPVPGLSAEMLSEAGAYGDGAMQRFSIFALGVRPVFAILFLVEIASLAFPALRRAQSQSPGAASGFKRGLTVGAAALAGLQAVGVAMALEAQPGLVDEPGFWFVTGIVVTFVGATALLIWFCRLIDAYGIGDGFWLLLATPILADLGADSSALTGLARSGAIGDGVAGGDLIFLAIAAAGLVVARLARLPGEAGPDTPRTESLPAILWPPILAYYFAGALAPLISLAMSPSAAQSAIALLTFGAPLRLLAIALMILAFTAMRARATREEAPRPVWTMALAQIVACVGGEWIAVRTGLPFNLGGVSILIVVTLATDLLLRTRQAASRAA